MRLPMPPPPADDARPRVLLGSALVSVGRSDEALPHLRRAVEARVDDDVALPVLDADVAELRTRIEALARTGNRTLRDRDPTVRRVIDVVTLILQDQPKLLRLGRAVLAAWSRCGVNRAGLTAAAALATLLAACGDGGGIEGARGGKDLRRSIH